MVPGSNGLFVGFLASAMPAASQGVTVLTERAYISCKPKREESVYLDIGSKLSSRMFWESTVELFGSVLLKSWKRYFA